VHGVDGKQSADLLENDSEHLVRRRPARHQRGDPPQRRLLRGQRTQILTAQLRSIPSRLRRAMLVAGERIHH
jgi:hypothetical protein